MASNFTEGLLSLLRQTLSNDTAQLKAATAQLKQQYYKNAECIPALAYVIANSEEQAIRQLAAVELRKRIDYDSGKLWMSVLQTERDQLKANFPELILKEQSTLVRHSAARVLAAISSIEVPAGTWPQLLPFLHQACISPVVAHREVGFQTHLLELFKLFNQTINDPESIEVRITTVRALGVIAQYIDSDDKQELAILVMTGGARHLFDVLETLLILEVPILSKNIPDLVNFLLQCGGNRSFEADLRVLALNALNWTVQYKKSKVQSAGLAPVMLEHLMPITTEEEPEDVDDEAPSRSALRIIDGLSSNLPPTQVFPFLRSLIVQYFSSADPTQRRGAMLALGVAVEGCSEFMGAQMAQVWPMIEVGLQDNDAGVRKATCAAVSCLCEWLEDECVAKHAMLVPAIMNLINDEPTQRAACGALDTLLEILHDVIDQYLHLIMERLAGLLETAPLSVKAVVTGAIGSAAHASRERFLPYFEHTMLRLQHFLVLTGEGEETELRGITMDAIGTFAEAVGKDLFRPYFANMMKQAFQGIEMESARLRECSFLFFGVMARVFGEEFAPYLPNVVPPLLQSCKQDEGGAEFSVSDAVAAFDSGSSPSNAIAISDDDGHGADGVELDDLDLNKMMDVNSAIAVEKEIAADTIGTLFASTKHHFFPYIEPCSLELTELLNHYYEGIRKSAMDSLLEIARTFYDLSDHQDWVPGKVVQVPVQSTVRDLINHVVPNLLEMYQTEDNKSVVSSLCVGFAETLNKIGPALVDGYLDRVSEIALQILGQKAFCQQDPDQDETEEAPEDQAEYDSVLISSCWRPCKKGRSLSDRSSAIGCLAEIIAGMKESVTPSSEPLLELFYRALSDEEPEVLSNAAFGIGLLVEHSQMDLSPQYLHVLAALQPLFVVVPESPATRLNAKDNAAGAVARLIVRNTAALPLDQVLPVWLNALPLKNDFLENRPVFRAIFHLFRTNSNNLLVVLPPQPDQIGDEVRAELIQLISMLNQEDPAKIQAAGLNVFLPGA
ncbi:armadillo-type protein [Armillaria mellea]|nr:armadillo-type protein [Armillaria mellea]